MEARQVYQQYSAEECLEFLAENVKNIVISDGFLNYRCENIVLTIRCQNGDLSNEISQLMNMLDVHDSFNGDVICYIYENEDDSEDDEETIDLEEEIVNLEN